MYPTLPTTLPAVSQGFGQSTTTTLGPSFESNERRRYSGGLLQRPRGPPPRSTDDNNGPPTPRGSDTAIGSPSSESDQGEVAREREEQYDRWLENMRVIESLREYVRGRLDRRDYLSDEEGDARRDSRSERESSAMDVDEKTGPKSPAPASAPEPKHPREGSSLYPILRMPGS
jgi:hypothetical protein